MESDVTCCCWRTCQGGLGGGFFVARHDDLVVLVSCERAVHHLVSLHLHINIVAVKIPVAVSFVHLHLGHLADALI